MTPGKAAWIAFAVIQWPGATVFVMHRVWEDMSKRERAAWEAAANEAKKWPEQGNDLSRH